MPPMALSSAGLQLVNAQVEMERKAFTLFQEAGERGNAEGLYNVAMMYKRGQGGLPRDFSKQREYCKRAAAQKPFLKFNDIIVLNIGVAEAENSLGIDYRDGTGCDRDLKNGF